MIDLSRATPRPWFAVNTGSRDAPFMSIMAERITRQGPTHEVALCGTGDNTQEMEDSNAALIVRAVNAHDELERACRLLVEAKARYLQSEHCDARVDFTRDLDKACSAADEALALLDGKEGA